jgi:hypothetical protein
MLSPKSLIIVLIFCRYFQPTHFSKFIRYLNPLSQNLFLLPLILCYANHLFSLKCIRIWLLAFSAWPMVWPRESIVGSGPVLNTSTRPHPQSSYQVRQTRPGRKFLQSHYWNFLCVRLILFAEIMNNIWG